MLGLLVVVPALLVIAVSAWLSVVGNRPEPVEDNLIAYAVLSIISGAAALSSTILYFWKGVGVDFARDVLRYAIAGAVGSSVLLTAIDAADDYFSAPGIGWFLPFVGVALGSIYGASFRALHRLLISP